MQCLPSAYSIFPHPSALQQHLHAQLAACSCSFPRACTTGWSTGTLGKVPTSMYTPSTNNIKRHRNRHGPRHLLRTDTHADKSMYGHACLQACQLTRVDANEGSTGHFLSLVSALASPRDPLRVNTWPTFVTGLLMLIGGAVRPKESVSFLSRRAVRGCIRSAQNHRQRH
jgi:hypothetical protein